MPRLVLLLAALALAVSVTACGAGSSSSSQASPSGGLVKTVEGAELYAEFCAGCHGSDGSGGSATSVSGQTDANMVAAAVADGTGSMPALGEEMSADQITAVSDYVVNDLK